METMLHSRRVPQLDGIRGIICFFVVFVHYANRIKTGSFPIRFIPSVFVEKGWIFVEFFFIISGFLIAYTQKEKINKCTFKEYALARLKRLYPPVFFITILDILVRLFCMNGYRLNIADIFKSLTFTTTLIYNGDPFPSSVWYIHVLFLCYVVYYIVGKNNKNKEEYFCKVLVLLIIGWSISSHPIEFPFFYKNVGRGYFAFSIGLLIYEFQEYVPEKTKIYFSYVMMGILTALLIMGKKGSLEKIFGDIPFCFTVIVFPICMIILLNVRWISVLLSNKIFVFLGKISMSIFLVHIPVINVYGGRIFYGATGLFRMDTVPGFLVVIASIILIAILWYYFVEKKLVPFSVELLGRFLYVA